MVSPLTVKVVAGAAALITGVIGGAFVAGLSSGAHGQAPAVSSTTPSRVASSSAPVAQTFVSTAAPRVSAPKRDQHQPKHAKHSHGNKSSNKD